MMTLSQSVEVTGLMSADCQFRLDRAYMKQLSAFCIVSQFPKCRGGGAFCKDCRLKTTCGSARKGIAYKTLFNGAAGLRLSVQLGDRDAV
jgi:hypothetical protein